MNRVNYLFCGCSIAVYVASYSILNIDRKGPGEVSCICDDKLLKNIFSPALIVAEYEA